MTNYPLAEIVSRLVVAGRGYHQTVNLPKGTMVLKILTLFLRQGLIQNFSVKREFIEVKLKYFRRKPLIKSIAVISKPGHRVYWSLNLLSCNYNANAFGGFYIISTSKGLFTSNECLTTVGQGGEVLYKITLN